MSDQKSEKPSEQKMPSDDATKNQTNISEQGTVSESTPSSIKTEEVPPQEREKTRMNISN